MGSEFSVTPEEEDAFILEMGACMASFIRLSDIMVPVITRLTESTDGTKNLLRVSDPAMQLYIMFGVFTDLRLTFERHAERVGEAMHISHSSADAKIQVRDLFTSIKKDLK